MAQELQLTDIPWEPEGAPVVEDAIYSLLVEAPAGLYMTPNCENFWVLARGHGLIHARGDFKESTDEELDQMVNDIWEAYDARPPS